MGEIFVFGSNLAGIHGRGSALYARQKYGALLGVGVGRTGNSYAIPTKDEKLKTLSLSIIQKHVENFLDYARCNRNLKFKIVKIGCGLAGYKDSQIAPMFKKIPSNCIIDKDWIKILGL